MGAFLPPEYHARLVRRTTLTARACAPSEMWVPVRAEEVILGVGLCLLRGWRCQLRPEALATDFYWCWRWEGYHDRDGYPRINVFGASTLVSRVWASICYGALSPKEDGHHVCRNKWCVNPAHIEPQRRGAHYRLHGYIRKDATHASDHA